MCHTGAPIISGTPASASEECARRPTRKTAALPGNNWRPATTTTTRGRAAVVARRCCERNCELARHALKRRLIVLTRRPSQQLTLIVTWPPATPRRRVRMFQLTQQPHTPG
uniref:Uncharacterized protein n=1 Tax=Plectus sambesii TaxID=2011161 RepID=A0A914VU58_9BILA